MTRLRAILIDDEALALRRLTHTLAPFGDVEVVASGSSARQARALLAEHRPDVLFLDIAMPGMSGLDLAGQMLGTDGPAVIFVTAFGGYAAAAFGVDAVDYLLKPVAPERLAAAIERARIWISGRAGRAAAMPREDSIWAYRHREYVRIRIADIAWVEADGDYVRLHAEEGTGLVRATLSAIEARLADHGFIRVHRSALCRRDAVTGLLRKPSGALTVRLADGSEIPAGRKYAGGLRALTARI